MSNDAPISRIYKDLELYTDDAIAKSNNPIPASQRYAPSLEWLEFLFRLRTPLDKSNEFICYHNKFYWRTCVRCRRSSEGASYWKAKLLPRVVALLSTQVDDTAKQ
jgi:hypothetical protein